MHASSKKHRLPALASATLAAGFVGLVGSQGAAQAQAQASAAAARRPAPPASAAAKPRVRTAADIVREAPASAWRRVDPNDVIVMSLASGKVYIELAERFAPRHAANLRKLVAQHYFDGLAILRVQDNYVAQWGDPAAESDDPDVQKTARPLGDAAAKLQPEFWTGDQGLKIARLKDRDLWAPVTGFVDGFPVAYDPKTHRAWIAHCYGTVGAGRDVAVDSANAAELYAVIGQSPRALDLNITPVGRVLQGMELLSSLPRGPGAMGFYKPEQDVRIDRVERLADIPEAQRPDIQVFRTESPQWAEIVESRRNRRDEWYVHPAGVVDMCNLTVPVKVEAKPGP